MLEATRNGLQDADVVRLDLLVAKVDEGKYGEKYDHKSGAKGVRKEGRTPDDRVASTGFDASEDGSDDVKEGQSAQAECGVPCGGRQILERVDDDLATARSASRALDGDRVIASHLVSRSSSVEL